MSIPPNQTLYISGINTKIKKQEIRRSLHMLCTRFGVVWDVIATRAPNMRGQAFVVFETVEQATSAMRQLQGFNFFDSELRVQYAKTKSDIVAKFDNTYGDKLLKRKMEEGLLYLLFSSSIETKLNPVKRFKAEMSNMSNKLLITNLPVQVDYATIHKLLSSFYFILFFTHLKI